MLLLVAAGGFFWLTSHSPLTLLRETAVVEPTAAIFVPKQAPVMVSLLVNPDRLAAFQQLATRPGNRRRALAQFKELENSLLSNLDLDYQQDIQPWVGNEITLAVTSLDIDRNRENAAQPGYLVAFTTKNPQAARESLQLFYSRQAIAGTTDLVFEQYKGVNLIYRRPIPGLTVSTDSSASNPTSETLTSAVVGDRFVLFANHPKVLRDAINNVQVGNLSLADDLEYQQMLQSLTEPRIGLSVVNLPALAAWISNQPLPVRNSFEASQTLTLAFSLDRQGLLAQTAVLSSKSSTENRTPILSQPVAALDYIPAQSALAIAGTDLNQLWNQFTAGLASENTLSVLIDQAIATWQSRWGIQLPHDIFSWVQGEYALSLLPRPDSMNPDWIFVAQKAAETETVEAIDHLDAVAKKRGLSVGQLSLGEYPITAWTKLVTAEAVANKTDRLVSLKAQVEGVHASVGNYEIFTTSIEAMDEALKGLNHSLLKSDRFQYAIAPLPRDNDGYLYLDWAKSQALIERQLPIVRVVELIGKPLFDHLRSLSISSYGIDKGVQRSKLFFQLADHPSGKSSNPLE